MKYIITHLYPHRSNVKWFEYSEEKEKELLDNGQYVEVLNAEKLMDRICELKGAVMELLLSVQTAGTEQLRKSELEYESYRETLNDERYENNILNRKSKK